MGKRPLTAAEPVPPPGLLALAPFLQRLLPAMLRRHRRWRSLAGANRLELLADLHQELRLDSLEHEALVVALPPRERHQRWFRLAERWIYRQRSRADSIDDDAALDAGPVLTDATPTAADLHCLLPDVPIDVLERLVHRGEVLGNGRCNATATGQHLGLRRQQVRKLWARTATRLGYDDEFLAFWQRRLAEAITGLAADLLLDREQLVLLPRPRRRPDPKGRLRRIRRIRVVLTIRPLPYVLRQQLARLLRTDRPPLLPTQLLSIAEQLQPGDPAIALWQFEAAIAAGDAVLAGAALRRARHLDADRTATALARARRLEVCGRMTAARRVLAHAHRHQRPNDGRLALALALADGTAGGPADSACSSARPSSASSAASARGRDHDGTVSNQPAYR